MTVFIYWAVAGMAAVLAWRAASGRGVRRANVDFAMLCAVTCGTYASFALVLVPGWVGFRLAWAAFGAFLPVTTLQVTDRFFRGPEDATSPLVGKLWLATPVAVAAAVGADLVFFDAADVTAARIGLGVFAYLAFAVVMRELWLRYRGSPYRVERARILYLLGTLGTAAGFAVIEAVFRVLSWPEAPVAELGLAERVAAYQGPVPPLSGLCSAVFLFFLYEVLSEDRLLDLQEYLARIVTVAGFALGLVFVDYVATAWVSGTRLHSGFALFVASTLFLVAYEPLRERVSARVSHAINTRGRRLQSALDELTSVLPSVLSLDHLARVLLGRLHASGRFPALALYVYDPGSRQVRLVASRGSDVGPPLPAVASSPFADGFQREDVRAYVRAGMVRLGSEGEARLQVMDAMNADLVVPLRSGDLVLGWITLKDEEWSDGFSHDELSRLDALAKRVSGIVENLRNFEAAKEQARLAALGTMSAGLAHEIRNPLAGIKGAAQYLEGSELDDDSMEFLQVVLDEVDRLDTVVSGFLNYARPFELQAAPADINVTVSHVLSLVRAEGLPDGVTLVEELGGGLPEIVVDDTKLVQVLLNLVQNALQAVPDGGSVSVRTRATRLQRPGQGRGPALAIEVRDDGPGISREALDKLFIPFYTTKQGGTGLGLAICERIVKAHGGELDVRTAPERGSAFIVRLPV